MAEKNILVVGGGAIGGMTAAHLVESGYTVTLYDTDEAHVKHINENGLLIEQFKGEKRIKIPSTTSLSGMFDVVFLSVKSNHTKEAINTILPHLGNTSLVVSKHFPSYQYYKYNFYFWHIGNLGHFVSVEIIAFQYSGFSIYYIILSQSIAYTHQY